MRIHYPIQRRIRPLRPVARTLLPPPPTPKFPPPPRTPTPTHQPDQPPELPPHHESQLQPHPEPRAQPQPHAHQRSRRLRRPRRPAAHYTTGPSLSRGHSLNRTPTGSLSGRPAAAPARPQQPGRRRRRLLHPGHRRLADGHQRAASAGGRAGCLVAPAPRGRSGVAGACGWRRELSASLSSPTRATGLLGEVRPPGRAQGQRLVGREGFRGGQAIV